MGTVASELKSEREKRKIPLSQIAAETRISMHYLQSLEEGRFAELPGGIYNRAFVKAYCETIDLDPQEIMQRYEAEISPVAEKPLRSRPRVPQQTSSLRIVPVIIWGLMLLISVTGLFFSRKWITAIFSPYFSHTPIADVREEPAQPVARPEAPAATDPGQSPPPQKESAEAPAPQPSVTPALNRASAEFNSAELPQEPAGGSQALRLQINAMEQCWISVDRDGSPLIQRVMQPGDVQFFNAAEKLQVILGNAGGVQLKINGKPARALGKPGEVVKVLIDENNLQDILDETAG